MASRADIEGFLREKTLALVGASRTGRKFGNFVLRALRAGGWKVIPVHRNAETIGGLPACRSLADLPGDVGGLVLVVPPQETERLVREAAERSIPRIWMQRGAVSEAAVEFCRQEGMRVVDGECILMFAEPVRHVHRLHRGLRRLVGSLPE